MKLLIHELTSAIDHLRNDRLPPTLKILSRVKLIQMQLFEQWAVLETLTPSEYMQFRGVLGNASGFQSFQYRKIEFLLGNKNAATIKVFEHNPEIHSDLERTLHSPSLYDEFLRYLARHGYAVPAECHRARLVAAVSTQRCHRPRLSRDLRRHAQALGGV